MKLAPSTPAAGRKTVDELLASRNENWPESVSAITTAMTRMFRLSDIVLEASAHLVESEGLTFSEFEVLATLRSFPATRALTPGELCEAVLLSSGGLTKVLYGLEDKKLIAREAGGSDKRSKPVRLTAKGRKAVERAMAAIMKEDDKRLGSVLSQEEIESLARLLGAILDKVEIGRSRTKSKDYRK